MTLTTMPTTPIDPADEDDAEDNVHGDKMNDDVMELKQEINHNLMGDNDNAQIPFLQSSYNQMLLYIPYPQITL